MQRQKMYHLFCLFVGQMEAQITIGEIDPSFGRILAAHRDFRPEESGEIDKVFAYFHEGGFHTLLLLWRAHESAPPPDTLRTSHRSTNHAIRPPLVLQTCGLARGSHVTGQTFSASAWEG